MPPWLDRRYGHQLSTACHWHHEVGTCALSSRRALLRLELRAWTWASPLHSCKRACSPEAVDATQSIALGANWIATFIVAQFFPLLSAQLGGKVYLIFAALSAFFFVFLSWYVPETKGKKNADEVWGRERRVD